jgi:23S rRNA pseudouridine2605 synthase
MASSDTPFSADGERIAKFLARAGVCSRRDAERLIEEGRVKLNGKVLDTPAVKVTAKDKIQVDDRPIGAAQATRLWRYHKPTGLVTTHRDPAGRPTVFDNLPPDLPRVVSVGRLDLTSEGLLLLTNDGELARKLELPANGWLRRYRARAFGRVSQEELDQLKDGITVDGVRYGSIDAKLERGQGANNWITVSISEGKNREVRRVLDALGLKVNRLIRIAYGPFQLGTLPPGAVDEIPGKVIREQLGLKRGE